jgi:hypothetical protein
LVETGDAYMMFPRSHAPAAMRRRRRRTVSVAWYLGIFIVALAAFNMIGKS